jgi:NADPH:quinone reductase-like Zn-dependent oxidoreductase
MTNLKDTETMKDTMRAIVQDEYGLPDVLGLKEIPQPVVGDDQVKVEVRASSVNAAEWHMVTGTPYLVRPTAGWSKPKNPVPGADMAGTVVEVGKDVIQFAVGDRVFGDIGSGAYAEYLVAKERGLVHMPEGVSFEHAGSVGIAGLTALQGLRDKGKLEAGQKVLINGASGGVGTFAVQIAKSMGAEVTAVCSSRNVEMALSMGADHVIDYTKEDFTRSSEQYDVLLDIAGNRKPSEVKRVLATDGTWVIVGGPKNKWLGPIGYLLKAGLSFARGDRSLKVFVASANRDDLTTLGELMASGDVVPMIENTYTLEQVPEALAYLGEGHSRGKNVIVL